MEQVEGRRKSLWVFGGAMAFLVLRERSVLTKGFLYAEDGSVYLRYAWDSSPIRALLAPHQSYYSLIPNLSGLIAARVLPLEYAGVLMVWCALAVQILLVYLVLRCEVFQSPRAKLLAVAVCLLTVPTDGAGLSTINCQFFLALCAGVILMSDARRLRAVRLVALILGGLTGVLSCILLPFFVWTAWRERSRARVVQMGVLLLCTLIQGVVVLHMTRLQARALITHSSPRFLLGAYLVNGPLNEFLTPWSGDMGCRILLSPKLQRWSEALWLATETAALAWLGLFFTVLFRGGKAAWKFALMGMFSLVVGQNGALVSNALLMCSSGVRYFCVCNSFIGFGLVCAWEMRGNVEAKWRVFTGVLIGCLLVSGASDTWFHLKSQTIESNWKMQVAGWRINPSMPLQIPPPIWGGIVLAPYHANANLPVNVYDSDNHPPCTKMKTQAKGTSWLFVRMAGRAR